MCIFADENQKYPLWQQVKTLKDMETVSRRGLIYKKVNSPFLSGERKRGNKNYICLIP